MENNYQQKIVDNIKHEPERHFVFIMPDDPEPEIEELKELKIILKKFDKRRKNPTKLFEPYDVCYNCDYVTRTSGEIIRHLKFCKTLQKCDRCGLKKNSEKIKECGLCDLKFDCNNCKKDHLDHDHLKNSNWHCSRCNFKTLNKESLKNHCQIHVKKFSCATCNQIFALNNQLKNHQQQHHHGDFATKPETKFECSTCDRSFATKKGLYHHKRDVHSQTKFHCDICGKISKTKNHLQQHMNFHLKIPCPICQHLLAPHRLREHVDQHSSSAKFECDDCEKVFSTKKNLYNHKRKNHEIDEVQCDMCAKIIKNKLLLRKHMRNHLKISCPICRKATGKATLKQHMEMHSRRQKSLLCNIKGCRQKFENIKELNDHETLHIGIKIYKCPKCDYQTKQLREMEVHMKRKFHIT